MSLPKRMVDRWERRTDLKPGDGQLYWHILFGSQPQMRTLASISQEKLVSFTGLHFTPLQWLHMTVFAPGPAMHLTPGEIEDLVIETRRLTSDISPITIRVGRILYHAEAIALDVQPTDILDPVRKAVRQATESIAGSDANSETLRWTPHVTLAYSTTDQLASPIISALGSELPSCEITIDSINLVWQEGPERLWNWQRLAEVPFTYSGRFPAHVTEGP